MIEAIILAAGESSRMGRLKPLIKINGLTFLQRITNELQIAGIRQISIVVGFESERIINESGVEAHFVKNAQYSNGQFSSLQCGIKALSKDCTGVVVCLGDQPQVKSAWVIKMVQKLEESNAAIIRPSFQGQSGHPIMYSAKVFKDILGLPPTATAKELMTKYKDETQFVKLDSDGILYDADTPQDFKLLEKYL